MSKPNRRIIEDVIRNLRMKKSEIDSKISMIKKLNIHCTDQVTFDMKENCSFLEEDRNGEIESFYKLSNPSPQTLLVGEVILGLLGRWELININEPMTTWKNIQTYFKSQANQNFCTL